MIEDDFMYPVVELDHSLVFIDKDQRYLGKLILIYKNEHIVGLENIPSPYYEHFLHELKMVSLALKQSFDDIELLNTMTMGNYIEHCHFHIFPRRKSDVLFGKNPLNGLEKINARNLSSDELSKIKDNIIHHLSLNK